jgi:signal transduction histidine kinase/DNA-binding response OmpR family regulator
VRFINLAATKEDNDLSSGNIRSLLQDSYGNIWIGNYSSGIDIISHTPPLFRILPYTFSKKSKYKNKPVWGIYAEDQRVWVGSENEIAVFDNKQLTKIVNIAQFQSRPFTQIFSLTSNKQDLLLLGLFDDGLLEFNIHTERVRRIELGMEYVDVITFHKDAKGVIWIGAEYGVYTYFNGNIRKEDKINSQLIDKSVYGILHDRQGKLWIGSYGAGIQIFDEHSQLVHNLRTENGFFSDAVNNIYIDRNGGVWVASRHGLGYIKDTTKPEQYEWYGSHHGLSDLFIRSIQEDLDGNIWISTNSGISLWNKETQNFNNYNYLDGIPAGNFIEGSSCITADGTIYFGSLNGVCYFNPQQILKKQEVARVQIVECKDIIKQLEENSAELYLPSREDGIVHLNHYQNSFRIAFAVPDYAQSQKMEYAYMMEGLEDTWFNTLGENQVILRSLPPGKYTFKVKARLKNQDWDEMNMASMNIYIHPPLWLTWYAKLLYLVAFCLIVIILVKSYKRRLILESSLEIERRNSLNEQNLNQERLRFYTNITHELRTPLTLILGPLEDLTNDRNMPAQYSKIINTIHGSTLRLLNLINQILEFRKTETQNRELSVSKGNIADVVTEIGLRYKELNQNPKLIFNLQINILNTHIYFDTDIITTIISNLLSNAVKYTSEGEISLILESSFESDNEYIIIKVSDTGYGIDPEALPHIFDRYYQVKGKHQASGTGIGLALVKSLATIHEATLDVESDLGRGTTFTLRLLTGNTYPDALHKDIKQDISEIIEEGEDAVRTGDEDESAATALPILLIVEDNDDIREYIKASFQSEYEIIEGKDGVEGLELAVTRIPNMIVSDMMMPEMDGIEFCRIIKEDIRTSHIPVILLTAKDSIRDKEEGYESGADSYITKPFSARLLRTRIQSLLDLRKRLAKQIISDNYDVGLSKETLKMGKLDTEFLEKLTKLIEDNLSMENLDITFLTQNMNMSSTTFYRKVKGLTGISTNEFIRKIKLKNSSRLLLSGDYNVSEAAYMTGFNNLSHFRKSFKREFGMTPSEYQKNTHIQRDI